VNTEGITIAVKRLIEEKNTLFDDLVKISKITMNLVITFLECL
jgi:hypothetical protein